MYVKHFGLRDFPFRITPDPAFLFWTADHQRAFFLLTEVAHGQRTMATILGEPGVGKTILLQHFLETRPKDIHIGMISSGPGGLGGLGHWLYRSFDLHPEESDEKLREAFYGKFLAQHGRGARSLLIVDEAQNVSDEDIVALTDLTEGSDMVSMGLVLVGHPQLRPRLYATHHRNEGGDAAHSQIGPMSSEEVTGYIRHRMAMSGCPDAVFDDDAMERIARLAGGVPRLINVLCEFLLISAFNAGDRRVDLALVDHVLQDVGTLNHLLNSPAQYGAAKAIPVHLKASPTSLAPEGVGTPTSQTTQDAELATVEIRAETEAQPIPANSPTLPAASHDITVAPTEVDPPRNDRIRLIRIAAGIAAAVALAVLSAYLTAPPTSVAEMQQDEVSGTQALSSSEAVLPVRVGPALPAPALLDGRDAITLRNQALNVGTQDPLTAAIGFARAALRGDARAAYYLGQHLEVGDGVPPNAALAAAWYELASKTQRSARRALQNLSETAKATGQFPAAPPRPLMGIIGTDSLAEFIWAAPDDAAVHYLIELTEDPDAQPQQYGPFDLSAAVLEPAMPARIWRVVSLSPEGTRISASGWHLIAREEDEVIAAPPAPR